jgi:hypothetical protein
MIEPRPPECQRAVIDIAGAICEKHAMNLPRRQFLHLTAGAAALSAVSHFAWAQAYPTRPVRLVVGFPPGGGTDITARLIGQWLSERLGQQFVIENRPGAGSNLATEGVARAAADGYTLLLASTAHAINATLYDRLNYNFLRDIAPVAGIIRVPNVMEVNPSLPPKSVSEFIAYAKANPGKVNYASGGNGTAQHLSGELFKMMTGVVMVHVPYRGDAPARPTLSVVVQVMFGSIPPLSNTQGRQAASWHHHRHALEALPDARPWRFRPGYEARPGRHRRAQEPPPRCRQAQQGNQCRSHRPCARLADLAAQCFPARPPTSQAHCRRHREVGQGIRAANIKPG